MNPQIVYALKSEILVAIVRTSAGDENLSKEWADNLANASLKDSKSMNECMRPYNYFSKGMSCFC